MEADSPRGQNAEITTKLHRALAVSFRDEFSLARHFGDVDIDPDVLLHRQIAALLDPIG